MIEFLLQNTPLAFLTQSLWRDETFSIAVARHTIPEIISLTARDYNTPLYYILLHAWVMVFGLSEWAIRLLSLLPHLLLTYVVYGFSQQFSDKSTAKRIAWAILLNPMLLIYAFEARGYSWFAFFSALSMFTLYKRQWLPYVVISVLAFYTHMYFLVLLAAQIFFAVTASSIDKRIRPMLSFPFLVSCFAIILGCLPWMPTLVSQWENTKVTWINPPGVNLILSVLGNLFSSYEGTPRDWWPYTALLSLLLVGLFVLAFKQKKLVSYFFLTWIFVPLVPVLGWSFFKPLYINRYFIFTTVAISALAVLGIHTLKNLRIRRWLWISFVTFLIAVNLLSFRYKKKFDSRQLFTNIANENSDDSPVYVDALFYFDALYYYSNKSRIVVYHDPGSDIPWYVGRAMIPPSSTADKLPAGNYYYFINARGEVYKNLNQ